MKESQRAALVGLMNAILAVSHVDQFTRYRASRLKAKLTGHPFMFGDLF